MVEPKTTKVEKMANIIVIVKDKSDYKVANGRLIVKAGETVYIHNYAGDTAFIKFDNVNPFDEKLKIEHGEIKTKDNIEAGYYPYTVTVNGQEAQASKPIIIVYPR